jgi:hypothetical protein
LSRVAFYGVSAPCGLRWMRAGGQDTAVLMVARPGADWYAPEARNAIRFQYIVVVQRLQCGRGGAGPGHGRASSAAGHPVARPPAGMECYGEATRGVNHVGDHAAEAGVRQCSGRAGVGPVLTPSYVGHCADGPVAQPVVDEGEQFSRPGDIGDLRARGMPSDGLDRRPAHQFAVLLGDVPAAHDGERARGAWVSDRPRSTGERDQ